MERVVVAVGVAPLAARVARAGPAAGARASSHTTFLSSPGPAVALKHTALALAVTAAAAAAGARSSWLAAQPPSALASALAAALALALLAAKAGRVSPIFPAKAWILDHAAWRPPADWFLSGEAWVAAVRASGYFSEDAAVLMEKVLSNSGLGKVTAFSPGILRMRTPGYRPTFADCLSETERILFDVTADVLSKSGTRPDQVDVVITSCSCFAPTPSMAAMIVNKFKMRKDVLTYSMAGLGCSSSLVCVDLAKHLLKVGGGRRRVLFFLSFFLLLPTPIPSPPLLTGPAQVAHPGRQPREHLQQLVHRGGQVDARRQLPLPGGGGGRRHDQHVGGWVERWGCGGGVGRQSARRGTGAGVGTRTPRPPPKPQPCPPRPPLASPSHQNKYEVFDTERTHRGRADPAVLCMGNGAVRRGGGGGGGGAERGWGPFGLARPSGRAAAAASQPAPRGAGGGRGGGAVAAGSSRGLRRVVSSASRPPRRPGGRRRRGRPLHARGRSARARAGGGGGFGRRARSRAARQLECGAPPNPPSSLLPPPFRTRPATWASSYVRM